MVDEEDEAFKYLSHATIQQAWAELKGMFVGWLVLSAICIVFGSLTEAGVTATQSFWSDIPKPILYILGFAAFTWLVRGEEFRFVFPRTFKLWLLTTSAFAVIVLAGAVLPTWAMVPVYFGLVLLVSSLESLSRIGRENYRRLTEESNEEGKYDDDDEA